MFNIGTTWSALECYRQKKTNRIKGTAVPTNVCVCESLCIFPKLVIRIRNTAVSFKIKSKEFILPLQYEYKKAERCIKSVSIMFAKERRPDR